MIHVVRRFREYFAGTILRPESQAVLERPWTKDFGQTGMLHYGLGVTEDRFQTQFVLFTHDTASRLPEQAAN